MILWFCVASEIWVISNKFLYIIHQIFGNIRGKRIAVVIDISDANAGFGRLTAFQESLVVSVAINMNEIKSSFIKVLLQGVELWISSLDLDLNQVCYCMVSEIIYVSTLYLELH